MRRLLISTAAVVIGLALGGVALAGDGHQMPGGHDGHGAPWTCHEEHEHHHDFDDHGCHCHDCHCHDCHCHDEHHEHHEDGHR
jgi:hypothetical protein